MNARPEWLVPYTGFRQQFEDLRIELMAAYEHVMWNGDFILRDEVAKFEESMAAYLGVEHVIGVGSGYDALYLSLKVAGIGAGDEVLTDSYTHISTHAAIVNCGAKVLLDNVSLITKNTKAWLPVHMNGYMQDVSGSPLLVIEDACQALGAEFYGRKAGTEALGCFSCHPMKILGCAGDGGFIATNNPEYDAKLRELRNHGGNNGYGINSRLDNLQAAILNVKLPYLELWIAKRRTIASIYDKELPEWVGKPLRRDEHYDVYSSYVIDGNPKILYQLRTAGIEAFSHIRTDKVSLPIYPELTEDQIGMVIDAMRSISA